jgi:hypothetical protein
MITPARKRELAVRIGAERTRHALTRTPDAVVYRIISDFDDFIGKPDAEVRQDAAEIAELIRTGQSIVTFPHLYEGTGDGEPIAAPIPMGLAGSPGPITINNPEGWEDSWDRERAADDAAHLAAQVDGNTTPAGAE